jgi:hypothetical protein
VRDRAMALIPTPPDAAGYAHPLVLEGAFGPLKRWLTEGQQRVVRKAYESIYPHEEESQHGRWTRPVEGGVSPIITHHSTTTFHTTASLMRLVWAAAVVSGDGAPPFEKFIAAVLLRLVHSAANYASVGDTKVFGGQALVHGGLDEDTAADVHRVYEIAAAASAAYDSRRGTPFTPYPTSPSRDGFALSTAIRVCEDFARDEPMSLLCDLDAEDPPAFDLMPSGRLDFICAAIDSHLGACNTVQEGLVMAAAALGLYLTVTLTGPCLTVPGSDYPTPLMAVYPTGAETRTVTAKHGPDPTAPQALVYHVNLSPPAHRAEPCRYASRRRELWPASSCVEEARLRSSRRRTRRRTRRWRV